MTAQLTRTLADLYNLSLIDNSKPMLKAFHMTKSDRVKRELNDVLFSSYSSQQSFFQAAVRPVTETCKSAVDSISYIWTAVTNLFTVLLYPFHRNSESASSSFKNAGLGIALALATAILTALSPIIYATAAMVRLGHTVVDDFTNSAKGVSPSL